MKRNLFIALFIFTVTSMFADIAPNPIRLKSIMPSSDCKVQMVSETVNAKIYKDSSLVECVFNMKNWGESTTIEVGFPEMTFYHWSAKGIYGDDITPFIEVFVGSKKIDIQSLFIPKAARDLQERIRLSNAYRDRLYKSYRDSLVLVYGARNREYQMAFSKLAENYMSHDTSYSDVKAKAVTSLFDQKNIPFYVWKVTFKSQENVTIKVNYRASCGMYKNYNRYFYYLLSTGAGWYKNIEQATIRAQIMDFDLSTVRLVKPSNYHTDQLLKEYIWDFKNLEPTKDDNVYLEYGLDIKPFGLGQTRQNLFKKPENMPLLLVDGVPFEKTVDPYFDYANADKNEYGALIGIAPGDIKEISVMKDSVATSLWGSKASNGVLNIITKRGKPVVPQSK